VIRWCSYCQRYQGDVPPYDDFGLTHGICTECLAALDAGGGVSHAQRLAGFYGRLHTAGRRGEIPSASSVLDEGIAMGLQPIDLLMGVIQPALYSVGESWAAGEMTVAREHAFTGMASALIALVMHKCPEASAFRRSRNPRVLLVAADGNYHTLGVQLVELILLLERIPVFAVYPGIAAEEVFDLWREVRAPVVGFSVALPEQVSGVELAVARFSRECPEPPRFVMGGFPVRAGLHPHPGLSIETPSDPRVLVDMLRTD
jgi:methanogenic corrinoid protein MtbC1